MKNEERKSVVLAITGASGALYGLTLADIFLKNGFELHLLCSDTARRVIESETDKNADMWFRELAERAQPANSGELRLWAPDDYYAPVASGSAAFGGMIVAPCSMGTLGRIAGGVSSNLIERSADVCLKERRPLVLMCRETPLSVIHLENMLKVSRAGGIIMPPLPAFYSRPSGIEQMVEQSCLRAVELLGFSCGEPFRWGKHGRLS